MATRKRQEFKTGPPAAQTKSAVNDEHAFPSQQERLPLHVPGEYQVAMGTREEIVAWLQVVPRNTRAILISFSNEASYRKYSPVFWHVAHELPEMVAVIRLRRFEQLIDALTQL
jgi:hypothetical protein